MMLICNQVTNSIKLKQGQNKFNPEYCFVSVFPLLASAGHFIETFSFNLSFSELIFGMHFTTVFIFRYTDIKTTFHYTLISTSTPLGNSSFIKASIVFDDEL